MCAPLSVGAIDPVGMMNASATNDRNTNAIAKAMITEMIVSFTDSLWGVADVVEASAMRAKASPLLPPALREAVRTGAKRMGVGRRRATECDCSEPLSVRYAPSTKAALSAGPQSTERPSKHGLSVARH